MQAAHPPLSLLPLVPTLAGRSPAAMLLAAATLCNPAVYTAGAGGVVQKRGAVLAAPSGRRLPALPAARRLACRAEKAPHPSEGSASDAEVPDWHSLAKQVAGRLASDLAGQEDTFHRLESW